MANSLILKTYDGGTNYSTANADATIYTVPSSTTTIIIGYTISNITTNNILVTVKITDSDASQTVNFMKNVPIPSGSSLEIMAGNKTILNAGDALKMTSDVANSFDVALSIVEQT